MSDKPMSFEESLKNAILNHNAAIIAMKARLDLMEDHIGFLNQQTVMMSIMNEFLYKEIDRILENTGSTERIDRLAFDEYAKARISDLEKLKEESLKNQMGIGD